jgi:hypothetical protein
MEASNPNRREYIFPLIWSTPIKGAFENIIFRLGICCLPTRGDGIRVSLPIYNILLRDAIRRLIK